MALAAVSDFNGGIPEEAASVLGAFCATASNGQYCGARLSNIQNIDFAGFENQIPQDCLIDMCTAQCAPVFQNLFFSLFDCCLGNIINSIPGDAGLPTSFVMPCMLPPACPKTRFAVKFTITASNLDPNFYLDDQTAINDGIRNDVAVATGAVPTFVNVTGEPEVLIGGFVSRASTSGTSVVFDVTVGTATRAQADAIASKASSTALSSLNTLPGSSRLDAFAVSSEVTVSAPVTERTDGSSASVISGVISTAVAVFALLI